MKLPAIIERHEDTVIFLLIFVPSVALMIWKMPTYFRNVEEGELKRSIINAEYYLKDATVIDRHTASAGEYTIDADLHLRISQEKAQEMAATDNILNDCTPPRSGCPDKTWQPFAYYVTSYGKTYSRTNYKGVNEVRNYNPALPNLAHREDVDSFSCTMYQARADKAYGLCVNPNSGDLWYHHYNNW